MLGWSINLFRIRGIQISLNWLFFLLLAWVCMDGWHDSGIIGVGWAVALLTAFFFCILLHELGHSFVAMRFGVRVPRILMTPIGGMALFDRIPRKPYQELLITVAGPAVNFAIAGLLWCILPTPDGWFWDTSLSSLSDFGRELLRWNVLVALFNLIPCFPMDGGRILRAMLASFMSYVRATFWAATVAKVLVVIAVAVSIYRGDYYYVILGLFIFRAGDIEYRNVKMLDQHEAHLRELLARPPEPPPMGEPPVINI
jgi:Zn-dependent protease